MTNPYYNNTINMAAGNRARARDVEADFSAVALGFDGVDTALALKAPLASPALTGVPTAPTAAPGTGTSQIATCAFVVAQALSASLPGQAGNAGKYLFTNGTSASWADPFASPALTGTPTAPTAAVKTATTQIATTAFVDALRSLLVGASSGTLTVADRGSMCVLGAGGCTIPASVFAARDVVTLYNDTASNITITQGSGLTLRLVGSASSGNRTIAQRGLATVVFISATEAVISGGGVT